MATVSRRAQLAHTVLSHLDESPPYVDNDQGVDLDRRIKIQKLVYLAQEALKRRHMTLQYGDYNWYIRGPYSPALARDCYALDKADADAAELLPLRDEAVDALALVRKLKSEAPAGLQPHLWLELLASLHYFATRSRSVEASGWQLTSEQVARFREYKPDFAESYVRKAWEVLKGGGLVP